MVAERRNDAARRGVRQRKVLFVRLYGNLLPRPHVPPVTEVSIIDQRLLPCYSATSVFTRADDGSGSVPVEYRAMDFESIETTEEEKRAEGKHEAPDLSEYLGTIERLKAQ